jgi:hypothetical protein
MNSITNFAPEIQSKLSQFGKKLQSSAMTGPERKNTASMLCGMLKKRTSHVSGLSRTLAEEIAPKKTAERLNRTLRKDGYWQRLTKEGLRQNRVVIRRKRFCVFDLSDIQKPEAKVMEGIADVYDSDASTRDETVTGRGYWWLTGMAVDRDGCLPVYSELYSLERERTGENKKILDAMSMLQRVHPNAIIVFDRGGDRGTIINDLIEHWQQFIIRGQDQRHLRLHADSNKGTLIGDIARRMNLKRTYKNTRNGETFAVGIRRVYLDKRPLWLVAARRRKCGLSWYLTNVDGTRDYIMDTVMEGYGYRWSIEEFHRQVKQDYGLERIRLQRYEAIKSMGVLIMLAVSFCAALPANLAIKLVAAARLLDRKRLKDLPRFLLYKLTAAVALTISHATKRPPKPLRIRKRDYFQLSLTLEEI